MIGQSFLRELASRTLIGDGAMGTELGRRGLQPGGVPEIWNAERPDAIRDIHRAYVEAGCDAILTNTFGANALRLSSAGLSDRALELAQAGVRVALEAAGPGTFVMGDVGPSGHGDKLPPYGDMDEAEFRSAFADQARALADAGAHCVYIETMSSLLEAALAVEAVKEAADICVVCSLSFRKPPENDPDNFRTFWGDAVETIAARLADAGADAFGANCGEIALEMPRLAALMRKATGKPLAFEPNAGAPKAAPDGTASYDMNPEDFGRIAADIASSGANLVGGCCGTTPAHMAAAARALRRR